MSFLAPAFLVGALAIAIPVVLHLLRRDIAPQVPFSAVRLLRRSPIERSKRRRLRDLLLLAARVAALLLLATAFARPYAPGAAAPGLRVVAIDRSFSMGAPGRFARALDLARQAIDDAAAGERVALIAFDERADLVSGPGSAADARSALASVQPGFGATRYAPVVQKALEAGAGSPGRVVIVTDLQRTGWEDEQAQMLPSNWQVDIKDVGGLAANAAVASVSVDSDRLVVAVRNGGSAARAGRIRVAQDGRDVAVAEYDAPPDATVDVPVPFKSPARGTLAVTVEDPQGVPADDVRHVVLDPPPQSRVLIVTGETQAFYLTRALETAAGQSGGFDARVVPAKALSNLTLDELSAHAAIVLLSTRGLDRRAREGINAFVRNGGGLFVAAARDLEPDVLSALLNWQPPLAPVERPDRPTALAATDLRHPVFRPFGPLAANLGQVRFDRVWRVGEEGWQVAARFTDGAPALLERPEGHGRVVLFSSDLDRRWNDFPLHPSFVPFVLESVRYVAGDRQLARDYVVARAPAGAGPQPGVYRVGPGQRPVAVNVDTRESSLARLGADEFRAMLQPGAGPEPAAAGLQARQTEARQSYWQYGLLLMLVALVGESFVGRPA